MSVEASHSIHLKTVIYIGASSVCMLVSVKNSNEEVEFLKQSIPLAHDIFSNGKVSKLCIERTIRIISGYFRNLTEYGEQKPEDIMLTATNILQEATNKENFLSRIQVAFGISVSIHDDGEMTRLLYLKTQRRLKDTAVMKLKTTLVVHVGPGNTRAILFQKGQIIDYQSYRLGAFRTSESINRLNLKGASLIRVIKENSGGQISSLVHHFKARNIEEIVVIGEEVQSLSPMLSGVTDNSISTDSLKKLCSKLANSNVDQIVKTYPFDYQSAEAALPAIEINLNIANELGIQTLTTSDSNYIKGLLTDVSKEISFSPDFENEVIKSATKLAEKFEVNLEHSNNVHHLCEILFQQLIEIHKLNTHDLLLLRAAAILHESGGFLQSKAHHKHSLYLISHSEIFGLGQDDVNLIALISRYHRNSGPKPNHLIYNDLSDKKKIKVTKLASILRIADALEKSHTGRIQNIEVKINKNKLIISLLGIQDASVERLAMKSKGDLFQDIFGLEIIIEESSN